MTDLFQSVDELSGGLEAEFRRFGEHFQEDRFEEAGQERDFFPQRRRRFLANFANGFSPPDSSFLVMMGSVTVSLTKTGGFPR